MPRNLKKKQIILLRHAKAAERVEWFGADFDRPLTPDGEESTRIMANYLRLIGVHPDCIISSPSARTKETADIIAKRFHEDKVLYNPTLYNEITDPRDPLAVHMNVVQKCRKDAQVLMLVGHNNDLTEFAAYLSGEAVPSMKKGSIVILSVPEGTEWKNIKPGTLKFVYYLTPQFLRLEELV